MRSGCIESESLIIFIITGVQSVFIKLVLKKKHFVLMQMKSLVTRAGLIMEFYA